MIDDQHGEIMRQPFSPSPQLEVAILAAQAGGRIVKEFFETRFETRAKSGADGSAGLVTEADIASERAIIQIIRRAFPTHHILAEETADQPGIEDHLWVIDPLDGTNNFAHGIPHFAISIAYCYQGRPICGVILDPVHNDWYLAEQGKGAWRNQQKVQVNDHQLLSETLIAVGFYYDRDEMMRSTLTAMEEFFDSQVHGIRRMGSAALDIVHVGVGRFGVYFEYFLSPWDFAAAWVFLTEAGGIITDGLGDDLRLKPTSVLATNYHLSEYALPIVIRNHPPCSPSFDLRR